MREGERERETERERERESLTLLQFFSPSFSVVSDFSPVALDCTNV